MTEQEATHLLALLFETHQRPIIRFLQTLIHDEQQAEDLCQETFMRAYGALTSQDRNVPQTEDHFKNWLYDIARNLAYDHFRSMPSSNSILCSMGAS